MGLHRAALLSTSCVGHNRGDGKETGCRMTYLACRGWVHHTNSGHSDSPFFSTKWRGRSRLPANNNNNNNYNNYNNNSWEKRSRHEYRQEDEPKAPADTGGRGVDRGRGALRRGRRPR